MQDTLQFNFSRFLLLLKNDLRLNHRGIFYVALGTLAVLLFIGFVAAYDGSEAPDEDFFYSLYAFTLLIGGSLYTSVAFRELNKPPTAHLYLTTPASTLEKFTAKWLLTTFGFLIAHLLVFSLFVAIVNGIEVMTAETETTLSNFNVFADSPVTLLMKIYIAGQSIYLLGAIAFKKYEFFKTMIAWTVFQLALLFVTVILFRLVFHDFFDGMTFGPEQVHGVRTGEDFGNFMQTNFSLIAHALFLFILPGIVWAAAFFKLKEKEI